MVENAANWPYRPSHAGMQPLPPGQPYRKPYGGAPDGLILAGAVTGLALGGLMLVMLVFQYAMFSTLMGSFPTNETNPAEAPPAFFDDFFRAMMLLMGFVVLISIAGSIVALRARGRLKRTAGQEGRSSAIVGAVLMLVGMNWIAGTLGLVGALLVETPPDPQVQARYGRA